MCEQISIQNSSELKTFISIDYGDKDRKLNR